MNARSAIDYIEQDCGFDTPCWIWQKSCGSHGYGQTTRNGKPKLAHRAYYEDHRGPIPSGKQLDHLCRIKKCVNPWHTEPVTSGENNRRGKNTKLTWDDVAQIRAMSGTNREIGMQFGVTKAHVQQIKAGKWWVNP